MNSLAYNTASQRVPTRAGKISAVDSKVRLGLIKKVLGISLIAVNTVVSQSGVDV